MTTQEVKRKLTAILSADVKGYSRLMGADEEGTLRTLQAYKEVMASSIQHHRGRIVGTAGDSVLAEFASVVDAVQCAVEIQQVLRAKNALLPETRRMEFRIGINLGDVIEEGDTIYGDGVNIAARLEGLAEAGGICISESAYEQIENKLPLRYDYLGEHEVKNIAKPVRVYRAQIELGGRCALPGPPLEVASKEKMAFPLPDKPSIAVLPFVNMSRDPEAGVLQRRDHRGDHHRPLQGPIPVCDCPQLHVHLQGEAGEGQAGERGAGCAVCAGGECPEGLVTGYGSRPSSSMRSPVITYGQSVTIAI